MTLRSIVSAEEEGERLDRFLTSQLVETSGESTRSQIKRAIESGAALVDGRPGKAGQRLKRGQVVEFEPPPPPAADVQPEQMALDIVYEDGYLVVVNKAAGMVVHPSAGHRRGTLVAGLLARCGLGGGDDEGRPGIVHRLDKDTTGLLVVTKDVATHEGLARQFRAHSIERRYLALVRGVPEERGTIRSPYGRHPSHRLKFTGKFEGKRLAVTHFSRLESFSNAAALLGCELETGRTHQVRVHLSEMGHPILGDPLYGGGCGGDHRLEAALGHLDRQALHAARLSFTHPRLGERLDFEAPPPADFNDALDALRRLA